MKKTQAAPAQNKSHTFRNLLFASICSFAVVGAIAYFVNLNMPDISVKVAAMQTGISASYPNYAPRDYSLSSVTSDDGKRIVLTFDGPDDSSFTLSEESTSWDTTALLNNYVKRNFSSEFVTLREQGITVYYDNDAAAWINGGILYQTKSIGKNLSKEQIRNLVVSL
ncbi:MAG: hypothetical protein Q4F60_01460 [Candidatus Saccharibacteria bacterium]|nr:hypothetical protein [Candidatus Saccharibacteria bacterium]